ncbi:MAG: glucose-6-phosphate isomerase [Bacteroidales bacterium]
MSLTIDLSHALPFLPSGTLEKLEPALRKAEAQLMNRTGAGNDFLGWLDLPSRSLAEIGKLTDQVASFSKGLDAIVVIGIGGSYLGARAVIDCLADPFGLGRPGPEVLYAGHHMHGPYFNSLITRLKGKSWGVVVISKSGTTTEPAISFRILRRALEEAVGPELAAKRIIAITDGQRGALRSLADQSGYLTFSIPDDVGGRFSVFTPVGLVPIALAGYDVKALLAGAEQMARLTQSANLVENPAFQYAGIRYALHNQGFLIEVLGSFLPRLQYVAEWWKQLYGESEGKEGKGIFPAVAGYTTDLHSMGQYMQEGPRILIESLLEEREEGAGPQVPEDQQDLDGLNFLAGKTVTDINRAAAQGTILAHAEGGVPVIRIISDRYNEEGLGQLLYFFEKACAISGYLLGVNPFDQPGVELYKKNMFRLLGKPGY